MTTMTEQPARVGRYLFADLVHLDVLIEANRQPFRYAFDYTPQDPRRSEVEREWTEWETRRDDLVAARDAVLAGMPGILCRKCDGKGRISAYSNRSRGLCYSCNGTGLTAKGRKLHGAA